MRVAVIACLLLAAAGSGGARAEEPPGADQFDHGLFAGEPPRDLAEKKGDYSVPDEYQVCIDPQYYDRINEAQTHNWRYQVRRRDYDLMRRIAGTWRSEEPNGVGGIAYASSTTHPEGSFTFEKRTCVSMPGLGTSCPSSIGHGYWAAHWGENGTIFMATWVAWSGYTGEVVRGVCGGAYLRMLDENTSQNVHTGAISRRAP